MEALPGNERIPCGTALAQGDRGRQWAMRVPAGRYEPRTARAVTVELLRLDDSQRKEDAVTENVSAHGTRVVTKLMCVPGKRVLFTCPQEGVKSLARVVYFCLCRTVPKVVRRSERVARPYPYPLQKIDLAG
jgi:hypothetical protein